MKFSTIFTIAGAALASASPAVRRGPPATKQICVGISLNGTEPLGTKAGFSIPPACAVCDALGVGCVLACAAGGPIDPACDACAAGSLGIVSQCLTCLAS